MDGIQCGLTLTRGRERRCGGGDHALARISVLADKPDRLHQHDEIAVKVQKFRHSYLRFHRNTV